MEAANQGDDLGERGVRDKQPVMVGVDNFALDVVENLTALIVDPTHTRRTVKTQLLEMAEKSMNPRCPRASRPMNRVIDSHDRLVGIAAGERLLHAARIRRIVTASADARLRERALARALIAGERAQVAPGSHGHENRDETQILATPANPRHYVETRLNRPPPHVHGKEAVPGSSPGEGLNTCKSAPF